MANKKKEYYKPGPMTEGKRNIIQGLLQEYNIESAVDIQEALKDLPGGTIKEMLEAEMNAHLGYAKAERSDSDDARNGYKSKRITTSYDERCWTRDSRLPAGNGREVYQGKNYKDGQLVKKATPTTVRHEKSQADKLCATIREACEKCGAHDGMTFGMILSAAFSCTLFSLAPKCRRKWRCLSWLVLAILRQRL